MADDSRKNIAQIFVKAYPGIGLEELRVNWGWSKIKDSNEVALLRLWVGLSL